ncbi:MAG: helix-hairpin-helix domain-containing protein [Caldisphaeraceae archaeon]|nr:helix-hairpin-helix domain-containing protein [Caldisphaeraceae archaeon]MEB3798605.1 helix-hairpin-helix domain-containing protein [Caldisphaeraceae archaeon]
MRNVKAAVKGMSNREESNREDKVKRIYADVREEESGIPKLLESYGIIVIRRQLEEGDYIIPKGLIIERKSSYDFVKSLFDGRLFDQAKRLSENYQHIIYIVEGDFRRVVYRWKNREKQIEAAMISLIIDFNAKVLWSIDRLSTANYLISLLKKANSKDFSMDFVIHKKPKINDKREWQLYILQSFPGIGNKTAERILEEFSTLERFFNCNVSELSKVLGEKKAIKIREIIKAPYKRNPKGRSTLDMFYLKDERNERGDV